MRRIIVAFLLIAGWVVADGADIAIAADPEARQILAPTGVLRAGLYTGSPTSILPDPKSGGPPSGTGVVRCRRRNGETRRHNLDVQRAAAGNCCF